MTRRLRADGVNVLLPPEPARRFAEPQPCAGSVNHEHASSHRLQSIDIVRGAVMILMALDHVRRLRRGAGRGARNPGVYFTRWITHIRCPGLRFSGRHVRRSWYGQSLRSGAGDRGTWSADLRVARYLVTRGLLLVLLELTVILGLVDVRPRLLSVSAGRRHLDVGLVHDPARGAGPASDAGHRNHRASRHRLPGHVRTARPGAAGGGASGAGNFIYPIGAEVRIGQTGPSVAVLYSLVPWVGVMAAGYAFGAIHGARACRAATTSA